MTSEVYEKIIDKLIQLVSKGTLKPNEKIYSENRMSMLLGVQRSQVREVYTGLEILGILEGRRGEGTFFKTSYNSITYKVLFLMLLMEEGGIEDITEVRKIIESGAAELACKNRTDKDIEEMHNYLKILEKSDDPVEMAAADTALHYSIGKASGNDLLDSMVHILSGYIDQVTTDNWYNIITKRLFNARRRSYDQHKSIVKAIEERNAEAARNLVNNHLDDVVTIISHNEDVIKKYRKSKEQ